MCVKINNEELFFNAFLFENSYYFSFWIGLDVVRSTGNLSSNGNEYSVVQPSGQVEHLFHNTVR